MHTYITVARQLTGMVRERWRPILPSGRPTVVKHKRKLNPARLRERRESARKRNPPIDVFLNLPYDQKFENLYLAYICGTQALGMDPRVTLEIPGGTRRLDKIFDLIQSCQFSVQTSREWN